MKKINSILVFAAILLFASSCNMFKKELTADTKKQQAALRATLPFDVEIAGQKPVLSNEFCAKIIKPVRKNAKVKINIKTKTKIVITLTPGNAEGLVKAGAKPYVLLVRDSTTSLDKTFSGRKLRAGMYVMRVNADDKIASILLNIK